MSISFKLRNDYGSFLSQILSCVDVEKFIWSIPDHEILYEDENGNMEAPFFDESVMNGSGFLKCIERVNYYLVYADIKAFKSLAQVTCIETYDDFLESDCEIALFCADTVFVDVYCRSEETLGTILQNCVRFGFDDLQILTREENGRTGFSVWN